VENDSRYRIETTLQMDMRCEHQKLQVVNNTELIGLRRKSIKYVREDRIAPPGHVIEHSVSQCRLACQASTIASLSEAE
jgi:hypothetical protein